MDDKLLMFGNPLGRQFADPEMRAAAALESAWSEAGSSFAGYGPKEPTKMTVAQRVSYRALVDALGAARKAGGEVDRLRREARDALAKYEEQREVVAYLLTQLEPPTEEQPQPSTAASAADRAHIDAYARGGPVGHRNGILGDLDPTRMDTTKPCPGCGAMWHREHVAGCSGYPRAEREEP